MEAIVSQPQYVYYIPYSHVDVITYPCPNSMLVYLNSFGKKFFASGPTFLNEIYMMGWL